MAVTKTVLKAGKTSDKPQRGDLITIEYTGWLFDSGQAGNNYKGKIFDTTATRGTYVTQIGVGRVIKGWDEGILVTDGGMKLGETCRLIITSESAYGQRGFPGLIPANTDLIFEVELKGINDKSA